MQVADDGDAHKATATCRKWTADRINRKNEVAYKKTIAETVFFVNGNPIENVKEFRYLGRVLRNDDSDLAAVERNLSRARGVWAQFSKVLCRKGANAKQMATFYKAVVQSVLLFGSETWVLTLEMRRRLESFHRGCARYITGRHIRQNPDGTWTCPSSDDVLEEAGLWPIQKYIDRRYATVHRYVSEKLIYRLCVDSKPIASNAKQLVWWSKKPPGDAAV
jgi:hypothetical protein